MTKIVFLILLFWALNVINAQKIPDSLLQKSDTELIVNFNNTSVFSEKESYANALIEKARSKRDTSSLVTGYHIMAVLYKDMSVLKYCDSIIAFTRKSSDVLYPATAYSIKGSYYYEKRAYKRALDNFLEANSYAKKHRNDDIIFRTNYTIGILKDEMGDSEAALELHRKNFAYAEQHTAILDKRDYLNSIFALANTFNNLKMLDSATFYNSYGIREALRLEDQLGYHHFVLSSGITNYYKEQYSKALDSIKKSLPYFEEVDGRQNMAVGYFYLGKLYAKLNNLEEAIVYLEKVDQVFQQHKYLLPKLRGSYEFLIDYYKDKGNLKQQLYYVEQLIKLDRILYDNESYLCTNIMKEYDIPRLREEKEKILAELEHLEGKEYRERIILWAVSGSLIIVLLLLVYQYGKRKSYKKQAEALIHKKHTAPDHAAKKSLGKKAIGVSEDILNNILSDLARFENNKGYLDPDITIHILAKKINTNANYLSKAINYRKGLSFTHYINKLRIGYAIEALKTNAIYRKYTNKALANEFGFKRVEPFSRAFLKYARTRPSDYIRELKNVK